MLLDYGDYYHISTDYADVEVKHIFDVLFRLLEHSYASPARKEMKLLPLKKHKKLVLLLNKARQMSHNKTRFMFNPWM